MAKRKKEKHPVLRCFSCRKKLDILPFKCRRCAELFCGDHRLPESHNCPGLNHSTTLAGRWMKNKHSGENTKKYYIEDDLQMNLFTDEKEKSSKKGKHNNVGNPALSRHKKKKGIPVKKIFWIILALTLIYFTYTNWGAITPYFGTNTPEVIKENDLDSQTIEAFDYVNTFRKIGNSPELIYEEELYEWVKAVAETKQNNPENYKTAGEFLKALEIDFDTSGITNSYYTTYFIGGKGVEKFLVQFNKNYNARNLIKDSKYNRGTIYCGLDYCVLFVFYNSKELIRPDEDLLEEPVIETNYISKVGDYISDLEEGLSKPSEKQISSYEKNPKEVNLPEIGKFTVYQGLNDYLAKQDRAISYYYVAPTTKDFILKSLDNSAQKPYLDKLVTRIKSESSNSEEQAKIAIRMVQKIPYDYDGLYGTLEGRMPYEVLYDMRGVCGEKSPLLAYILRELGFGVAIFEFDIEGHESVGIRCSSCDYKNSGYCFIESTSPTIPTDSEGEYLGAGKLGTPSEIINIADGKSLDLSTECKDAEEWNSIVDKGEVLSNYDYSRWVKLVDEYDMEIE